MSEEYFLRDWNPSPLVLADEVNHRFNSIYCSCSAVVEGGRTVNAAGEGEENLKITGIESQGCQTHTNRRLGSDK